MRCVVSRWFKTYDEDEEVFKGFFFSCGGDGVWGTFVCRKTALPKFRSATAAFERLPVDVSSLKVQTRSKMTCGVSTTDSVVIFRLMNGLLKQHFVHTLPSL